MTAPEEQAAEVLAGVLYAMNGTAWYGRDLGDWDDPESRIGRNEDERDRWRRQAAALAPLFAEERRKGAEAALREAADAFEVRREGIHSLEFVVASWLRERADTYAEGDQA